MFQLRGAPSQDIDSRCVFAPGKQCQKPMFWVSPRCVFAPRPRHVFAPNFYFSIIGKILGFAQAREFKL